MVKLKRINQFDKLLHIETKFRIYNTHTYIYIYIYIYILNYTYNIYKRQLLYAHLGMFLHELIENMINIYIECIFWSAEWDPWGVPDDYECEVIENDAPVPKHVPLHRPPPLPTEFHKTLEALSSPSGKDTPAATSSESPSKT